jgi:hypothetical protein
VQRYFTAEVQRPPRKKLFRNSAHAAPLAVKLIQVIRTEDLPSRRHRGRREKRVFEVRGLSLSMVNSDGIVARNSEVAFSPETHRA